VRKVTDETRYRSQAAVEVRVTDSLPNRPSTPVRIPPYTVPMSGISDLSAASEPPDPRIDLLRRALQLSGVEPLVAGALALEHYGRIIRRGRRFEVTDAERDPDDQPQPDENAILHLAEQIKQGIPAKFLTDATLERERADQDAGSG